MNSKIYLAKNIKLDKNYKAVLNYSESDMLSLITNDSNLVYAEANAQFIRDTKSIIVKGKYNVCIQANYMAFSNPDYSNKWFFAFIDEVIYKGENNTEIKYTIDVWSTWHDYWQAKACFVVREHVTDDTIGTNTVPEGVELGEYISCKTKEVALADPADFVIIMAVSELPDGTMTPNNNHTYNGVFSGLTYLGFKATTGRTMNQNCWDAIRIYDKASKGDAIYGLFMAPKEYIMTGAIPNATEYEWNYGGITTDVFYLDNSDIDMLLDGITGSIPTTVGKTYVPKNKKLFTYPYSYMNLTNNSGSNQQYFYEDFDVDSETGLPDIEFANYSALGFGMSIRSVPLGYKNVNVNWDYSVVASKIPVCSWNSDTYTNWLTQNALNVAVSGVASTIQLVGGAFMMSNPVTGIAGAGNISSGINGIIGTMGQIYQHSLVPNTVEGNTNSSDVNFGYDYDGGITLYYMSIRDEYAERIDKYFTRMGYKVNKVKVPNMSYRENYNYVQVANEENVAYPNNYNNICLPATVLNDINNLFRNGITIWNNHTNFGDYSVSNTIVVPTP